jgi:hypothetical protein
MLCMAGFLLYNKYGHPTRNNTGNYVSSGIPHRWQYLRRMLFFTSKENHGVFAPLLNRGNGGTVIGM